MRRNGNDTKDGIGTGRGEGREWLTTSPSGQDDAVMSHYDIIDSKELARRLTLPESWIRDQVRERAEHKIPHLKFGKYVRFRWGSPELEDWLQGRIVVRQHRDTGRVR